MRELSATRTRTALAGWAGLVCTLATARIEVPTGPRCNAQPAALTIDWGARSPRAFDGYRFWPAVRRSSWRREILAPRSDEKTIWMVARNKIRDAATTL